MKIKALRRQVCSIAGIVAAIVSLLWLYFLDVTVSSSVIWLLAAIAALCAAAFAILSSYFVINSESKKWIIFDALMPVFQIGFIITLFPMKTDVDLAKQLGKLSPGELGLYSTFYLVVMILAFVVAAIMIISIAIDVIDQIRLKKTSPIAE